MRSGIWCRPEAGHRAHVAEGVVEHVAPVAEHVEDHAAAILGAIVPRRALRRLQVALEHPVAELALHREDAAEEPGVDQQLELAQARQEQLVLHHAVLDAGGLGLAHDAQRLLQVGGDRLLGIDVLARLYRFAEQCGAHLRGGGVEEYGVVGVGQRRIEVGGDAVDAVGLGQRAELVLVAPDQDRIGHDAVAVAQDHAALGADGDDRAHEVLVGPHAPRHAVHDDAEPSHAHSDTSAVANRVGPNLVDPCGRPVRCSHAALSIRGLAARGVGGLDKADRKALEAIELLAAPHKSTKRPYIRRGRRGSAVYREEVGRPEWARLADM